MQRWLLSHRQTPLCPYLAPELCIFLIRETINKRSTASIALKCWYKAWQSQSSQYILGSCSVGRKRFETVKQGGTTLASSNKNTLILQVKSVLLQCGPLNSTQVQTKTKKLTCLSSTRLFTLEIHLYFLWWHGCLNFLFMPWEYGNMWEYGHLWENMVICEAKVNENMRGLKDVCPRLTWRSKIHW